MPKGFSEVEKQRIGERLLTVGRREFTRHGLRKVTVEELAVGAGISKGAFYLFYPSKEALLMDVVEQAEAGFRQTVLAAVDEATGTPRARLFWVLRRAFTLWKTIPLLQRFTQGEYEVLARRVAPEQLEEHLQSDRSFVSALIDRCRAAGIPMQVEVDRLAELLHVLFFVSLHEDDLGAGELTGAMEVLLELVAAYCLGEVTQMPVDEQAGREARR
jgi:AcrR family transcriptional regulator